jgi:hypothetical protein
LPLCRLDGAAVRLTYPLPIGARCGTGLVEDYAGRTLCRKGDAIETRRPVAYCDFNYPVVARANGALGSDNVVACVYVGELRKMREVGEEQVRGLVSDTGLEEQARALIDSAANMPQMLKDKVFYVVGH